MPPDVVHAHALASGGAAAPRRHSGRHQSAGRAESALHRRSPAGRRARRRRLGGRESAGDARHAGRARATRASTPSCSVPTVPSARARWVSQTQARRAVGRAARADQERAAARRRDGDRPRARAGRASARSSATVRRPRARAARRRRGLADARDVRRLRAARRDACLLSRRRRVRAVVGLRQLAERRARSDGVRAAGRRDRRRRRARVRRPRPAAQVVPPRAAPTRSRGHRRCTCRTAPDGACRRRAATAPRAATEFSWRASALRLLDVYHQRDRGTARRGERASA